MLGFNRKKRGELTREQFWEIIRQSESWDDLKFEAQLTTLEPDGASRPTTTPASKEALSDADYTPWEEAERGAMSPGNQASSSPPRTPGLLPLLTSWEREELSHVANCSLCLASRAQLRSLSRTLAQAAGGPTASTSASEATSSSVAPEPAPVTSGSRCLNKTGPGGQWQCVLPEGHTNPVQHVFERELYQPDVRINLERQEWKSFETKGPGQVMNVFKLGEGWEARCVAMVPLTFEFRQALPKPSPEALDELAERDREAAARREIQY